MTISELFDFGQSERFWLSTQALYCRLVFIIGWKCGFKNATNVLHAATFSTRDGHRGIAWRKK